MKRWQHIRDGLIHFTVGIVVISMIIWTGDQAQSEQIAPTVIAAFILMTLSVTNALIPVSDAIERIPSYRDSLVRITNVEDAPASSFEGKHSSKVENISLQTQQPVVVQLEDVSYRYPESKESVLKNLSLTIPAGKRLLF